MVLAVPVFFCWKRSLELLFGVDVFKALKSALRSDTSFSVDQVHKDTVRALGDSLPGESSFLSESSFVAQLLFEVIDAMQKLAPFSVMTMALVVVELGADLSLVVAGKVRLGN